MFDSAWVLAPSSAIRLVRAGFRLHRQSQIQHRKSLPRAGIAWVCTSCFLCLVNWHQIIDERSYEMHQVISEVLQREPGALNRVVLWIEQRLSDPDYSVHSKDALAEWLDLIQARGLAGVIEVLADRGEDAVRLRHSSPFAILMPQDERRKILQRYETLRPRTHPAGV